jgi:cell division protein FtsZ
MEVDEAASHIKELVDPDANIIWGSAFNNDLDGKIRVSVVATGIEAEAEPRRSRPRSSPSRLAIRPAEAPVAAARPAPVLTTDCGRLTEDRRLELLTDEDGDEGDELAARQRRHPDQPGRVGADRSAIGRGNIVSAFEEPEAAAARAAERGGGRHRRHLVRADVEHRPRRASGEARRRIEPTPGFSQRADRHSAVPQPAEQPVTARGR